MHKQRTRALVRSAAFGAAILTAGVFAAAPAATAATKVTIYNNIPAPLPGNVPSVGFEASAASEFGGQVTFESTERTKPQASLVLSSWGCESGSWNSGDCSTLVGATFFHPITVNVYTVGANNEPGDLIGTVTHTFSIPYRPSANYTHCTGDNAGKWYSKADTTCYNGKAVVKSVSLGSLDLPDSVIISVAYNTTHSGYNPIGESACYTEAGGCPYDALNVGTSVSLPAKGTQPLPNDAYFNSAQASQYCEGGPGSTGTFRLDAGCWTGFQPAFRVKAL